MTTQILTSFHKSALWASKMQKQIQPTATKNNSEATHKATWIIKTSKLAAIIVLLLCFVHAPLVLGQTVAPFQGVGAVQFFDNNANELVNGVLYSYQAGTTTQLATYTDATGTIQNTNPITFTTGGRAVIWTTIGATYKFVLCLQNDGAFCAPSDVLFSVDNVPGGASSSGGGGSSPFTGIFISSSSSPASSGILRLASGDSICWRNAAGSTNLCFSKNSNDLLSWAGGSLLFPEISSVAGSTVAGSDLLWADNSAHRWMMANNGGTASQVVASGVDINTSDQVIQFHFGATATPLCSIAPTTGQGLFWNGTQICGGSITEQSMLNAAVNGVVSSTPICGSFSGGTIGACSVYIFANAHTLTRLVANIEQSPGSCSTAPVIGVRDLTTSTNLATVSSLVSGIQDSGAISIAITAGDKIAVGLLTPPSGCGSTLIYSSLTANYQ